MGPINTVFGVRLTLKKGPINTGSMVEPGGPINTALMRGKGVRLTPVRNTQTGPINTA